MELEIIILVKQISWMIFPTVSLMLNAPGSPGRATLPALLADFRSAVPGLLLCAGLGAIAGLVQLLQEHLFGRAWLDAPVLAILAGTLARSLYPLAPALAPGINFAGRTLLEIAIVMLGAALSASALSAIGLPLGLGIALVVTLSIGLTYLTSRLFGLSSKSAILIACGNSICGNSAILAVAPVVGANSQDVGCAITFTSVVGIVVVIFLPVLALLEMTELRYGIMAGLIVYAVPQVLAATAPLGAIAIEVGTVVKLVRVLMLGPVCVTLSLLAPKFQNSHAACARAPRRPPISALLPWFIVGFLLMAACRSADLIPQALIPLLAGVSKTLTIVSLAALGLGVDLRGAASVGARMTAAVIVSVLMLGAMTVALISLLPD